MGSPVRCYYLKNGHIIAAEMLAGIPSDEEAIAKSHELFAARTEDFEGFEIWDTTRVVFQWTKPKTSAPMNAENDR